jgi:hypothetical protein
MIDDPERAYTRPWTVTLLSLWYTTAKLLEYILPENNKYFEIIGSEMLRRFSGPRDGFEIER